MPKVLASLVRMCAISALRSSALDGMHPTLRQTPPQYCFSMMAVLRPSWLARIAATYPPGPAPRTTTSKCCATGETISLCQQRPCKRLIDHQSVDLAAGDRGPHDRRTGRATDQPDDGRYGDQLFVRQRDDAV